MAKTIHRVLVRRDDNLGDIVISLPVLEAIRKNYPRATIDLMMKEPHRALCKRVTDRFLDPVPIDVFTELAKDYDVAFNIEYFGPGNHTRQTLAYGAVTHVNALPGKDRRPMSQHLLAGLASLGLNVPFRPHPAFSITPVARKHVADWLHRNNLSKKIPFGSAFILAVDSVKNAGRKRSIFGLVVGFIAHSKRNCFCSARRMRSR